MPPLTDATALAAHKPDIRLVAVDMDGTLLDENGQVPPGLWDVLRRLGDRGVAFAPASGRQYATLRREFDGHTEGMMFIAENGTLVVRDGEELSSNVMERDFIAGLIGELRALPHDIGVVKCGKKSAYIERADDEFRVEVDKYYAEVQVVDDLTAVDDDTLKLAVFDFGDAEKTTAPALEHVRETHQVVVSGAHWVDVMNQGVNKGHALKRLQDALGVTPAQTAVFGDYLNDLEMMDGADYSFAMANAHPRVAERARYRAPSNADHGVLAVLNLLIP